MMVSLKFRKEDIKQILHMGITEDQVRRQIEIFRKETPYLRLNRPCSIGDGLISIAEEEIKDFILHHKTGASQGRFMKFVPASGAASRMFKTLLQRGIVDEGVNRDYISAKAGGGDKEAREVLSFMEGIKRFAFYEDLKSVMASSGLDPVACSDQGRFAEIIDFLLTSRGLDYSRLPKGLLKFHRYQEGGRTAFEEHLVEGADYVRDGEGCCCIHFTVSPEHRDRFVTLLDEERPWYEREYNVRLKVGFSLQKPSTNTIAVDMDNNPFREENGSLLFRPGGHGALIENINDLNGDIIFVKNIDNVVPDRLKGATFTWKKVLGGYLTHIQEKIFSYLEELSTGNQEKRFLEEVTEFARDRLYISPPNDRQHRSARERGEFFFTKLNRPVRVCGMVRNEGEPGGGPFWVEGRHGTLSLQIVESAQIDPDSNEQQEILASATHFNPVDLVCGVRDYKGVPFDLRKYVDSDAVFISRKSKDGRDLKALELPGLWNGAMADWITVFVEVPIITFNPVKTVNDLLRKEHQP